MTFYTVPIYITIAPGCLDGIYLRWISPLGNLEGWWFAGDADDKDSVDNVTSVVSADGRRQVAIRRPGTRVRTARAGNLTTPQFDGLSTLLDSPAVWAQNQGGQRTPVYVVAGSLTKTTADGRHIAAVDIMMPFRNALTN